LPIAPQQLQIIAMRPVLFKNVHTLRHPH